LPRVNGAGFNRGLRKPARPVVWEGEGAKSPSLDPILEARPTRPTPLFCSWSGGRRGGFLGFVERRPTFLGGGDDACAALGAQLALGRLGRGGLGFGGFVVGPSLLLSQGDTAARGGAHGPLLCGGWGRGCRGFAGSRLPSKLAS